MLPLRKVQPYLLAVVIVAAVTVAAVLLRGRLELASVGFLYLLPVIIVSSRSGLWPGLFASALAALNYNFFLLPPHFTLWVNSPDNVVTLLALFTVAAVTSHLAAQLRNEKVQAEGRARASAAVAGFAQTMAGLNDEAAILRRASTDIAALFGARIVIFLELRGGDLFPAAAVPDTPVIGAIDTAAAHWTHDNADRTGRGTRTMASADWMFAPLIAGGEKLGVLGIARDDAQQPIAAENALLFDGVLEQLAQSIGRIRLAAEQAEIERLHQRDELRAALLSSLGHDLRTPLTVILGRLKALHQEAPPQAAIDEIYFEARRLERLVGNLLGMARVEAGAIMLATEPVDLTDAIEAALSDFGPETRRLVETDVPVNLPLVAADPRLLHHILINLIGNAQKYGPPHCSIAIQAAMDGDALSLSILDEGPGIPSGQEKAIFDRFTRLAGNDRIGGTGLGLAIVRGFTQAMGIDVTAANRIDKPGAVFTLRFPSNLVIAPTLSFLE
ncbi:DUF4118 domain-containing protein [Rhizorhapis suberifaciens]|uniref:histidine kinase n=1 Tax=Rhizorhapis suberifaciens TaxID=13656 RepID=A0A840HYP6_9SPHN|nr:DUF4118 domain-containing protein [Rhizorhapis suberifaciens]MBB4642514.1 K+-sensing histidine kinase KdpD [Rhizorhapis suberifaciens]